MKEYIGEYTWGKIEFVNRDVSNSLVFYPENYPNLSSAPLVSRFRPLRFNNYTL